VVGVVIVVDGSLRRPSFQIILRLARNAILATIGVTLSIAALPASALATAPPNQTAPQTLPTTDITSASATLEGWLGSEQPEPKAPKEGPEPEGSGAKEPIAPSDPKMVPASWYFEYAPGASCTGAGYATTTEHMEMFRGFDEVGVTVTGLQPSTEYTACLVDWHTVLPGVSFTTLAEVGEPTAALGSSENLASPLPPVPTAGTASKPQVTGKAQVTRKALELAKALKACKRKPKRQRASCERQARKRYAVPQK
jgi:hypothetical protein